MTVQCEPPTKDLKKVIRDWERIKHVIEDTECGGETWDYLAEDDSPETGIAQHALWRGCEEVVKLCHEINDMINLPYPHDIPDTRGSVPVQSGQKVLDELWEICEKEGVKIQGDLVGVPGEGGFLLLKLVKKIVIMRQAEREE
jgi:hypothetical protein